MGGRLKRISKSEQERRKKQWNAKQVPLYQRGNDPVPPPPTDRLLSDLISADSMKGLVSNS